MANPEDLGRYRLKRLLGRGALGEVWEANDLEMGSKVVVKIMHAADDELAIARSHFAREARLASLMRHPHVVAVHDAGEAAGTSFMVMEMVEGKSLRAMMKDSSVTISQKLRWIRQIGDGLSAMHRAGVVHRDVKPENIIVRPDGTTCLVDLGIAKWVKFDLGGQRDPDENEFEAAQYDPPPLSSDYRPPETGDEGHYDELGDQYAWGVLAYEVLTGTLPNEASPRLTSRDDIPHPVAVAIDRARSYEREDRWDGMEMILDELVDHTASKRPKPNTPSGAAPSNGTTEETEEEAETSDEEGDEHKERKAKAREGNEEGAREEEEQEKEEEPKKESAKPAKKERPGVSQESGSAVEKSTATSHARRAKDGELHDARSESKKLSPLMLGTGIFVLTLVVIAIVLALR